MKKEKIEFTIKTKEELRKMSQDELLIYAESFTDYYYEKNKPKKDSSNSSIAPSTEINKPKSNQSLREPSDKKSGGQKGHAGKTLEQTDTPDEVIKLEYNIEECSKCGASLSDTEEELKAKRQILDIEIKEIKAKIKEYQSFSKICPKCKFENYNNNFPKLAVSKIGYGANINALVSYLNVSQYLSYNRIVDVLSDLFNINISEGTIGNILKRTSKQAENDIKIIKEFLEKGNIIGIDETGCDIDSKRYWHWTFQNKYYTYIVVNKSRGAKVINDNFENGFENASVVHDNYSSYNSLNAKNEQLCLAHKLRDLNYAIQCDDTTVLKDIKQVIKSSMADHKLNLNKKERLALKKNYESRLDLLLQKPAIDKSETQKQINSFSKAKHKIFTFLLDPEIPPDNNGSERAIRNIKVKNKVSGQFKSFEGAECYSNIRTIIDTSRKQNLNEFQSLVELSNGNSIFPKI